MKRLFSFFLSSTHSGSLGITGSGRAAITSCAAVGEPPPAAPLTSADLAVRISISAACVTDSRGRMAEFIFHSEIFFQNQIYFHFVYIDWSPFTWSHFHLYFCFAFTFPTLLLSSVFFTFTFPTLLLLLCSLLSFSFLFLLLSFAQAFQAFGHHYYFFITRY